jgi:hypothetical protein
MDIVERSTSSAVKSVRCESYENTEGKSLSIAKSSRAVYIETTGLNFCESGEFTVSENELSRL